MTDLSDAVGRLYTMSSDLRPLYSPMRRVLGTAVTVKAPPGDNWAIHGAFGLVIPDSVLVVDWRSTTEACGAGVKALLHPIENGLCGIVIDGAWRDIPELEGLDFPVIGTGTSPFSPAKEQLGEINVPISCGGVVVNPGDLIVGDAEGTVVIPRDYVSAVAERVSSQQGDMSPNGSRDIDDEAVRAISDGYWRHFDAKEGRRA